MSEKERDFELYDTWAEYKDEHGAVERREYSEPGWEKLKVKVFQYYSRECAWCGSYAEEVHHEKYTPPDVQTPIEYLVALCHDCHTFGPDEDGLTALYDEDGNMKEHHITDHMGNEIDMDDRDWFDKR